MKRKSVNCVAASQETQYNKTTQNETIAFPFHPLSSSPLSSLRNGAMHGKIIVFLIKQNLHLDEPSADVDDDDDDDNHARS